MQANTFMLETGDGNKLFVYNWTPDADSPKAAVQIAHGMAEHAGRYAEFANALVDAGYTVFANDHRGHGKTAGALENVGYFADENGWRCVVDDMMTVTAHIKKTCPDIPVFLFGHSMGSFLARHYAFTYGNEIKGLVLSGTGGDPGFLGRIGAAVAKVESAIKGRRHPSGLMNQMSFGSFNKPFKPNRTDYDWLSSNEEAVDAYIADPYCGAVFSAGFFQDLLSGLSAINKSENVRQTPQDLPIYVFSGEKDPVGEYGKGVRQIYMKYKNAGITDLTLKLYPEGRHEMLNETNRAAVYQDVIEWLDHH